jgi:hypothetical protein
MATVTARSPLFHSVMFRPAVLVLSLVCVALPGPASSNPARQATSDLVAHEWGTFTSIADHNGHAIQWYPRSGADDLPEFVEYCGSAGGKRRLQGTIRMETPVLYFYSPTETTVSVKVRFSKGVITEWYPHASRTVPDAKKVLDESVLLQSRGDGEIAWDSVAVKPSASPNLPHDETKARYYAARETSSAPLIVRAPKGEQQEKFLFYRGLSVFPLPITTQLISGGKVLVKNLQSAEIPSLILFERRGDKLGYRFGGTLQAEGELQLDSPELTSTVESFGRDLADLLMSQGLYPDEAQAMVETWKSSWFEEGSRLLYIVPPQFVNTVLPLSIKPAPAQTVRVFVGRMELITPASERAVEAALAAHDNYTATRTYGRFLQPIVDQLKAENPARAEQIQKEMEGTYNTPVVMPIANR